MDVKIKCSDIEVSPWGEYVFTEGLGETLQKLFINAVVRKGSFVYNKNLGTKLRDLDPENSAVLKTAEVLLGEAVIKDSGAKIKVTTFKRMENGSIKLEVCVENSEEIKTTEVMLIADL